MSTKELAEDCYDQMCYLLDAPPYGEASYSPAYIALCAKSEMKRNAANAKKEGERKMWEDAANLL